MTRHCSFDINDNMIQQYKARLVAKGYSQVEGIDFGEICSPIFKLTSITFVVVAFDFELE